ncbi:MAG: class I SAM-dependent rRNA methyltransferase [Sphaerochaeta sp.]|jgi:23S rRNA (cytosine1962-C5)-methyltransferase|nr:class I SAM-dependent rRNA methyltransferase [Spirochaetales bacterium]
MQTITIKAGKEKQLLRRHPWVFSGAIETKPSTLEVGVSRVQTDSGHFIAWGWYDEKSHIPLRLLSWIEEEVVDDQWLKRTIAESVLRRSAFFQDKQGGTTTFRLIHGEADFLPGLTVDVYGTMLSVTVSARFAWDKRELIVETLQGLLSPALILLSVDSAFNASEQLKETTLYWQDGGWFIPEKRLEPIRFREDSVLYEVIPGTGQKSGFYCDRREIRTIVERYGSDAVLLDLGAYTGSFTLHALRGGAKEVTLVDSSASALEQAVHHVAINEEAGIIPEGSGARTTTVVGDMFEHLRTVANDHYNLIVIDPPRLATTKAQTEGALKAYKDLNRLAMERIQHNGIIATFSSSANVTSEMLRLTLAFAATDANVEIQILHQFTQGEDHPIRLSFGESAYLDGFLIRVLRR